MTPGLLGNVALVLGFVFTALGFVLAALAWWAKDARYVEAAKRAAVFSFLAALLAFFALEWALLTDDFSIVYTAQNHSTKSPTWVKFATLWAALEGSILLWATFQALYTLLAARRLRDYWMAPAVLGTLFAVQLFFFGVMLFVANPFTPVPNPPTEGPGPNPLLQNHWMMAVHPVLMYLGFVGISVPFAYAVAAMLARRYQSWVAETRWWTLIAFGFLTAAIFAGGWWSYEVLGWGGYWAWDPVENASFIPWLLLAAFLHTALVQARRGMFKTWNFAYVTLAFAATVFGTFLTRSGVIQSVHAFVEGAVGPVFLGFLLLVLLVGFTLLSRVASEVRDVGGLNLLSREGLLLGGSLVFATMAFVVVLGTLFPLFVEAVTGDKVSVGAPFFDSVFAPLGAALLFLMGAGPVLPWGKVDGYAARAFSAMLSAFALATALALLLGATFGVAIGVGLFAYNLVAVLAQAGRGVAAWRKKGRGALSALLAYLTRAREQAGAQMVHFGVALAALAIVFSQAYRVDVQKTLEIGERAALGGVELALLRLDARDEGFRYAVVAEVEVEGVGRMYPRLHYYPTMNSPLAAPSVHYGLYNDDYLILQAFDTEAGRWATLRLVRTPLVLWLWIAGGIILFGVLYIVFPGVSLARRRRAEVAA